MVGKIEFDLHDLLLKGGKMQSRVDRLAGEKDGSTMPGELYWEVGFFGKTDFNKKLATHGNDIRLPPQYIPYKLSLTLGYGINPNLRIHKGSWTLKLKQMPSIPLLIQHIRAASSRSSYTRLSIWKFKISQVLMAMTVNSRPAKIQGKTRRRKGNISPVLIVPSF
jgi:hypothetical protein